MFKKIKAWLLTKAEAAVPSLRLWALQIILEAERRVPGETGAEKKAYVVKTLDELIRLPLWLEAIDGVIFSMLVDLICDQLNAKYGHIWGDIAAKNVMPVIAEKGARE